MNSSQPKNIAASVRQRLLNRARSEGRPFQELLQYYAMERFLFRLSKSEYRQEFILKGALMLRVWHAPETRSTMDIDVLGRTSNAPENVVDMVKRILPVSVEPDGLTFDSESVVAETIREAADYEGLRIRFRAGLDGARISMQMDVGFGDVVFPEPEEWELPSMLEFPAPRLLCYSRESVIAEKFEAMLKFGELNSRMKDFYDIWLLSRSFDFDVKTLTEAIRRTLERRGTVLAGDVVAFSDEFAEAKQVQWSAFRNRIGESSSPEDFAEVIAVLREFLSPIITALD